MPTQWGDREARRRDILAAGRSLLREAGLPSLQMREVARRAGIALGTVYSYFPTKELLFSAMYAERLDEFHGEIRSALGRTNDIEELLIVVVTSYRDMYVQFGSELDVLSIARRADEADSGVDVELLRAAGSIWLAVREIVVRAGARDPDLTLTVLWSTMTGLADHFTGVRKELSRLPFEAAVDYAVRLLVSGIALERDTD